MVKAQVSLVVIVLIIVIFMIIGIFMIASTKSKPENIDEYYNLYAHNLLLSILRSDTGYGGTCKTFSDVAECALVRNGMCGNRACIDIVKYDMKDDIERILKPKLDFLIIIEPENWENIGGNRIMIGNNNLIKRNRRWSANEKIIMSGENINVRLILATK